MTKTVYHHMLHALPSAKTNPPSILLHATRQSSRSVLIVLVLILMLVSSCEKSRKTGISGEENSGSTSSGGNTAVALPAAVPTGKAQRPRILLVMKTLANPFFIEMEKGAREAEKQLGIELVVKTAAQETSIPQQITIMEEAVRDKFDAIVLAPGDSVELVPSVAAAKAEGIVVVNIDNRLDPAFMTKNSVRDVPFISVDNREGARLAAATLVQGLPSPVKVVILEGIRGAANAEERKKGALQALGNEPGVTVLATETANWKIDEAREVTARLLKQHPDIACIYCANDMMALGAIRALQEARKKGVRVGGFDALPQAMEAMASGDLYVTVDQAPADQGRLGVEYAVKLLAGESVPSETILPVRVLTQGSGRDTVKK